MSNTFIFANLAGTTLAGPISSTATTINIASGTNALFPHPAPGQQFAMRLISASNSSYTEIVYVTAVSGDALTVIRGQESTAALNFNAGDFAKHVATAGCMAAFLQQSQSQIFFGVDSSGSANGVTVASWAPATTAATAGMLFLVKKNAFANIGAVTLTQNGVTEAVVWADGSALAGGDWPGGAMMLMANDGAKFCALSVVGPTVWARYGSGGGSGGSGGGSTSSGHAIVGYNFYTSSQTITVPAGATGALVVVNGAGGAGGYGVSGYASGGGGGSGAWSKKLMTGLTAGGTMIFTAAAGQANSAALGSCAGTTTLASGTQAITTISCSGGFIGSQGQSYGAEGGAGGLTATGGDLNMPGNQGASGSTSGGGGGTSPGGAGYWGGVGQGGCYTTTGYTITYAASQYGAGGASGGSSNIAGQSGGGGACEIIWLS